MSTMTIKQFFENDCGEDLSSDDWWQSYEELLAKAGVPSNQECVIWVFSRDFPPDLSETISNNEWVFVYSKLTEEVFHNGHKLLSIENFPGRGGWGMKATFPDGRVEEFDAKGPAINAKIYKLP